MKQVILVNSNNELKIRIKNSNFIVENSKKKILLQHSCYKIFLVIILGDFTITSGLLKYAEKFNFPIVFLSYSLKPYFVFSLENKGNFLLRKLQYCSSSVTDFNLAKWIIKNKAENQLELLKEIRYKSSLVKESINEIELLINKISTCENSTSLLGIEGNISKIYFKTYFRNINFPGRKPRVKTDIFNLLLDIGYYYLFNFIEANLLLYGFDIYYGFYHKLFYQRKSLVCDLIEPFRVIIDKKLLKMYNLKQINFNDFYIKNNQFTIKKDKSKKYSELFLKEILRYKEDIFIYIRDYYRAIMKQKEIKSFPIFNIKK